MKFLKVKIVLILIALVFVLFFFDDYDIIDVEKTAIITAVAIDYNDEKETDEYTVTAQIAVPEANDTNTESTRTELSGKGGTIGAAIKQIGDLSGWYPHLSFCNLIILGKDMCKTNVIKTLDYFTKTLRLQDSAMVILSETSAKELLETTTPLDKISSFAIQKILFKNKGFDTDVASVDVKDFCLQYYDVGSSSFMPIVGAKSQFTEETGQSGGSGGGQGAETAGGEGGQGGGSNEESAREKKVFHANVTALFKEGRKVGELSPEETLVFNAMRQNITGTTLELTNVKVGLNKPQNYLITVIKNKCASKVCASENGILFSSAAVSVITRSAFSSTVLLSALLSASAASVTCSFELSAIFHEIFSICTAYACCSASRRSFCSSAFFPKAIPGERHARNSRRLCRLYPSAHSRTDSFICTRAGVHFQPTAITHIKNNIASQTVLFLIPRIAHPFILLYAGNQEFIPIKA